MPTNEPSPLFSSPELFRAVIDSDGEPVVICTLDHTIVYMNPTAVRRYESAAALHLSAEACSIAMLPQRARLSGVFLRGSERAARITACLRRISNAKMRMFIW